MLKAISDRIIVKPIRQSDSCVLLDKDLTYTNVGIVQSIGDKVSGVKIGDKILFHLFDELPLPEDGLVVIRQKSLLGMWE